MINTAVAFKDLTNGFERLTDGLWTHLGKLVTGDLVVNRTLSLPAGSVTTPMLAPNAAQQLIGQYSAATGWVVPGVSQWYESDARCNFTTSGGLLRVEVACAVQATVAGQGVLLGAGYDGGVNLGSLSACHTTGPNFACPLGGVGYISGCPAGLHRMSIFLYAAGGPNGLAFHAWAYQQISVTEQKR